jgi:hypothetical protein
MDNPNYSESRIVLFPHGSVQSDDSDIFIRLLLKCGADIDRFWINNCLPNSSIIELDDYLDYLHRSRLCNCDERGNALVALAKTNPPAIMLTVARRSLVAQHPELQRTLWIAWIDLRDNPFIFTNLRESGTIEDEVSQAPIWIDRDDQAYLLLVPDCTDYKFLRIQAERVIRLNNIFARRESTASRRMAIISSVPPPTTEASLRRPLSWTERGNKPPRYSHRVPKPQ